MEEDTEPTRLINLRIAQSVHKAIRQEARDRGLSVPAMVRVILGDYARDTRKGGRLERRDYERLG